LTRSSGISTDANQRRVEATEPTSKTVTLFREIHKRANSPTHKYSPRQGHLRPEHRRVALARCLGLRSGLRLRWRVEAGAARQQRAVELGASTEDKVKAAHANLHNNAVVHAAVAHTGLRCCRRELFIDSTVTRGARSADSCTNHTRHCYLRTKRILHTPHLVALAGPFEVDDVQHRAQHCLLASPVASKKSRHAHNGKKL